MDSGIVYIIDDDPAARESVAALMSSRGLRAETFGSAEEFLAGYDKEAAGCVVTDMRMLDMSGLDLQEVLHERGSNIPVIMLTAHANVPLVVRSMRAGAVTVLEKPCDSRTLEESVLQALEVDRRRREVAAQRADTRRQLAELTDDEREVLDLIMEGKPNKVIARRLDVGLRTVEGRRHNIFKKMGCDSLAELVRKITEARVGDEGPPGQPR